LTVTHHDRGGEWVVELVGEADLSTQTDVQRALRKALSMNRDAVVVDVSGLTFCDSTCVSAVLDANREGCRLVLAGQKGMVGRVFQLLDPGQTIARYL
jgi:anti-anti-sigma factor